MGTLFYYRGLSVSLCKANNWSRPDFCVWVQGSIPTEIKKLHKLNKQDCYKPFAEITVL